MRKNSLFTASLWNGRGRFVRHGGIRVAEMLANVHAQAACAASEPISLRTELSAVALLAEQITAVLGCVGAVQSLLAQTASKAGFVPLRAGSQHFFGCVHRFATFRALRTLGSFERHCLGKWGESFDAHR